MSNQRGAKARQKRLPSTLGASAFLKRAGITKATATQKLHLQSALEHVYSGWCSSKQGYAKKEEGPQPGPRDGRPGGYPGIPIPWVNPDPDNQAHFRWVLMFHSSLYEIRVSYFDIADDAEQNPETVYGLLTGVRFGLGETRVRATIALWLRMLREGFTLTTLLAWVAQDGHWLPDVSRAPRWQLDEKGFAAVRQRRPQPARRRRRKTAGPRSGPRRGPTGRTKGRGPGPGGGTR